LARWEIYGASQMFEHFDGRASDVIVECIANAGGHQLHAAIGGGQAAVGEIHGKAGKEALQRSACNSGSFHPSGLPAPELRSMKATAC
jgi:hypothetical protein